MQRQAITYFNDNERIHNLLESMSNNDFEIVLFSIPSKEGNDNKEKFIKAVEGISQLQNKRSEFIAQMKNSDNDVNVEEWRIKAVEQLKDALTSRQKFFIERAYTKEQIEKFINNNNSNTQHFDLLYQVKQQKFCCWLKWFSKYKETVSDVSQWASVIKKEILMFVDKFKKNDDTDDSRIVEKINNMQNDIFIDMLQNIYNQQQQSKREIDDIDCYYRLKDACSGVFG